MLGDTGVAVHPEDERYQALVGKKIVLPLVGREIPIVADEYSDPEKGTGAVKITPAHDFNDFEVGRRHDLAMINIFDAFAKLNDEVPEAYRGLDRFEARKRIVSDLEALGLLEKIEPHDAGGAARRPLERRHRAVADRPVVRQRRRAGEARARGRQGWQDALRPGALRQRLLPLAREHPALVHLAPALVGPSDSGVVLAGNPADRCFFVAESEEEAKRLAVKQFRETAGKPEPCSNQ